MIINHNIAALNTYRQLSANGVATQKSLEKLSSGLRINRAGDDAAGLAISEKMRAQVRGLDQAARNAQDGISLIQTAEGALNETHAILQRMRELANQAANDTNVVVDRGEIQKEINQLTSEINRIGNTTEFNTMKLVNGDRAIKTSETPAETVPVTKAITQTIAVGPEPITWSDPASETKFDIEFAGTADNGFDWALLDKDETNELIITKNGNDFTVDFTGQDTGSKTLTIDADIMSFDVATSTYSYNNQGISFSFTAEDVANWADGASVTMNLNTAAGAGTSVVDTHTSVAKKVDLVITGGDATVAMSAIAVNGDGSLQTVDQLDIAWDEDDATFTATLKAGGDEVSKTVFSLKAGETLNYDADGISFTFVATAGTTNNTKVKGSFALKTETVNVEVQGEKEVTSDNSLFFQVGANQNQAMALDINDMRSVALGISSTSAGSGFATNLAVTDGTNNEAKEYALDVSSHKAAAASITTINDAIEKVSAERSKLGAVQNRLEHTINNLGTSAENLTAAESRIRDVDYATAA